MSIEGKKKNKNVNNFLLCYGILLITVFTISLIFSVSCTLLASSFFQFSKEVIATELEEIERDEKVRFKRLKGENCVLLESRKVEKMSVEIDFFFFLWGGACLKMLMVVMKM